TAHRAARPARAVHDPGDREALGPGAHGDAQAPHDRPGAVRRDLGRDDDLHAPERQEACRMTSPLGGLPRLPINETPPWAGWLSTAQAILQATSSSGPTTMRPTVNLYVGQFWFDTTLGYPVWVKTPGAIPVWVNAAGAPV